MLPVGVAIALFGAWMCIYRLDRLNRSWQASGLRLNPTVARLLACCFLFGAADKTVELVRMVANRVL